MPIINLCESTAPNAKGHLHTGQEFAFYYYGDDPVMKAFDGKKKFGPFAYWTNLSHQGLCLKDFERNGYDDSDFCMLVWNPVEKKPYTVTFASTRGWSYPCYGSSADATPEVRAEYTAYQENLEAQYKRDARKVKIEIQIRLRKEALRLARENNFPHHRLMKLRHRLNASQLGAMINLFGSRVRSNFKLSLRNQLINWLRDDTPKFPVPLSNKQLGYL